MLDERTNDSTMENYILFVYLISFFMILYSSTYVIHNLLLRHALAVRTISKKDLPRT